ncbi:hypothetical protein [Paucidesulfovibrio longus]|uniref:hypothetical protein n=1 Tax=Paucidesulfovibrio longus TaxID=889 RepID=UPI0003B510BF|nr:hypothetical protein [Paucidesulfovibrio longus]
MAFWTAIVRYIAVEKLRDMGEDVLAHGRAVFAEELAAGKTQKEAARVAAKAMTRHAADKGKGAGQLAGRTAARIAGQVSLAAKKVRGAAGSLGETLRRKLGR